MSGASSASQPASTPTPLPVQRWARSSLPAPLTSLLGRETEIDQICEILDTDTIRLLTLTGPGGIGKTRIALEVASRLESEYAHGVCFVPLAPIQDVTHVIPAVAKTLGIQESGDATVAEVLSSVLRDRHMLLALDNFEHVLDAAAPWLSNLLARCPRLTVLVTSRAALHVTGEWRFPVPPLPVPDARSFELLSENAAVKLFVARAAAVHHDFELDDANAESVRDICHHLDGIPLAIELAAARSNVLSPSALLSRLTDQLTVLAGGSHDLPARHQTMRNAIAWSYDLLSEREQLLFRYLSAFTGGFSLEAAASISAAPEWNADGTSVMDVVASLIDQSLVRHASAEAGEIRFGMLEVIRQFGLDQLQVHGETDTARDAHARWCLALARESEPAMDGSEQVAWLDRLELEHENIRGALTWLTERERIEEAQDLAGSIWFFLWIRGYYTEGRQWYRALLGHPLGNERTVARGKAVNALGIIARCQGDLPAALAAQEEAIAIFRECHATRYLARALLCLGVTHRATGRLDEADAACTESQELARTIGDAWGTAAPLVDLGLASAQRGDTAAAWSQMQACADLYRAMGNRWGLSLCLGNLGTFAMAAGDASAAERYWQESAALTYELGAKRDLPFALLSLAEVSRHHGDPVSAEAHLREALTIARETGDVYLLGCSLLELGKLATHAQELNDAVALLRESVVTFLPLENVDDLAECMVAFADVAIATGEMERAARFVGAADAMLDRGHQARQDRQPGQHQARLGTITSALGMERYRNAWSGGAALTQEEALTEAMFYPPSSAEPRATSDRAQRTGPAHDLSPRELDVLRLMADGLTNQDIADMLFVSPRTVASHATNILGKLGLTSRTGAVAFAIRNGLA